MINCVIIDDEQAAIKVITNYMQHVPDFHLLATTTNPVEGLHLINNQKIDLVFLDIQMPEITGIELIKNIHGKCKIIIISAYSEFALEGFELDVIDYLLKPVPLTRFLKATQKAREILKENLGNNNYDESGFIMVKGDTKGKLIKVELSEIDYIEGAGNYVTFYCGAKKILSLINMKDLEEKLPQKRFIRIHKSFIVSLSQIASLNGNALYLKNHPKAEIVIGKVYKPALLDQLKLRMIG